MKIENYIKNAEKMYYDKKIKQSENAKTIILKCKSKTCTLEDINNYNEKRKPAIIENEINSIYRTLDKKIAVFKTTTLNPNYNISTESKQLVWIFFKDKVSNTYSQKDITTYLTKRSIQRRMNRIINLV